VRQAARRLNRCGGRRPDEATSATKRTRSGGGPGGAFFASGWSRWYPQPLV
jgi:hypothetical protein